MTEATERAKPLPSVRFRLGLRADAQTKPFKISGQGVGPTGLPLPGQTPRSHWIVGEATELGRHYGEGTVRTDSAAFDPNTPV